MNQKHVDKLYRDTYADEDIEWLRTLWPKGSDHIEFLKSLGFKTDIVD